jgi:hypothetical protein
LLAAAVESTLYDDHATRAARIAASSATVRTMTRVPVFVAAFCGAPHDGQAVARLDTDAPQSGQVVIVVFFMLTLFRTTTDSTITPNAKFWNGPQTYSGQ